MTSEAQKKSGYLIPDEITGHDLLCVQMMIPNDLLYIGAFTGQLEGLAQWWNWHKTYEPGDTDASQAAQYWRYLIDTYLCIRFNEPIEDDGMACCCGNVPLSRFTADGVYQESTDGGLTWHDAPQNDPRNHTTQAMPLSGDDGADKRCTAATAGAAYAKSQLIDDLTSGMSYAEVNAALVGAALLLGVTGVGILITALGALIFVAGVAIVQAAFTSEVWDRLKCNLYCNMSDDASFTNAQWVAVLTKLNTDETGIVNAILHQWIVALGAIGLTNLVRSHFAESGDCSACDCACGGETVGLTMNVYFGTDVVQTGCTIEVTSLADGVFWSASATWDGTHPFKLTGEHIVSGTIGSPTRWQWYLSDGSGPFTSEDAPIGVALQTLEESGHADTGDQFRTHWDVATP